MPETCRHYMRVCCIARGIRRFKCIPNEIAVKSPHTNFTTFTLYFLFFSTVNVTGANIRDMHRVGFVQNWQDNKNNVQFHFLEAP